MRRFWARLRAGEFFSGEFKRLGRGGRFAAPAALGAGAPLAHARADRERPVASRDGEVVEPAAHVVADLAGGAPSPGEGVVGVRARRGHRRILALAPAGTRYGSVDRPR